MDRKRAGSIGAYRSHVTRVERALQLLARQRTLIDRQAARLTEQRQQLLRKIEALQHA